MPQEGHGKNRRQKTVTDSQNIFKTATAKVKLWLSRQSFTTGLTIAALCLLCYAVSFAQMLLPVSATVKGVLWVIFFGLAKTFQYTALLILGIDGVARIKKLFKK